MADPGLAGAVQETLNCVVELAVTVGAAGAPGGSFRSLTLTVTAMESSIVASGWLYLSTPSVAFTVME